MLLYYPRTQQLYIHIKVNDVNHSCLLLYDTMCDLFVISEFVTF